MSKLVERDTSLTTAVRHSGAGEAGVLASDNFAMSVVVLGIDEPELVAVHEVLVQSAARRGRRGTWAGLIASIGKIILICAAPSPTKALVMAVFE